MFGELVSALSAGKCVVLRGDDQGGIKVENVVDSLEQFQADLLSEAEALEGRVPFPTRIFISQTKCEVC